MKWLTPSSFKSRQLTQCLWGCGREPKGGEQVKIGAGENSTSQQNSIDRLKLLGKFKLVKVHNYLSGATHLLVNWRVSDGLGIVFNGDVPKLCISCVSLFSDVDDAFDLNMWALSCCLVIRGFGTCFIFPSGSYEEKPSVDSTPAI